MSQVIDLRVKPLGPTSGGRPPRKQVDFRLKFKLPRILNKFDYRQPLHWLLIFALLVSITAPIVDALMTHARYDLRRDSSLLGNASPTMAAKISYDGKQQLYQFNKDGVKKTADQNEPSIPTGGDSKLYSADLPVDASKGVKIYDNVNNLTVGFTPQFKTLDGKQADNRLIYPLDASSPQLVYTAKANGLKEDLIIPRSVGDTATFKYQLNLGSELEAKLVGGGVGIYSADPTLFGNISFGSDADRQKVEQARKTGAKTNLAFYIPTPVVKQSGKASGSPAAKFALDGNTLTVTATGLKAASYPLSIDPSFIVTSSSNDFRKGNNEGIDFDDTNNQILRPGLIGGTLQTFTSPNNLNTLRNSHGTAVYNNCLYAISGASTSGAYVTSVEYATVDSSGTLSGWTNTSSTQLPHVDGAAVAYNGYLYALEGNNGGGGGGFDHNEYVKINSDCTLGTWADTTVLQPNGIGTNQGWRTATYNGYIYVTGGYNGSLVSPAYYNTTFYAKLNADGTIGTWVQSTNLPEARHQHGTVIYNGYLYVAGGAQGSLSQNDNAVKLVKINSDGSLGSTWTTTTSFPINRADFSFSVANGYLYTAGGQNGVASNDVLMAPIYANGTIGAWQTTSTLVQSLLQFGSVVANGYLFTIGGSVGGASPSAMVERAKIDSAGSLNSFFDDATHNLPTGSWGAGVTVYNGVIYVIGGCQSALATCIAGSTTDYLNTAYHTTVGSDGTLGTWSTDTALPTSESGIKAGRFGAGVVAYNGYLYVAKGDAYTTLNAQTQKSDVLYTKINTDGSIANPGCGTVWCVAGTDTVPQGRMGTVAYNGWLYMIGGDSVTANSGIDNTRIAQFKTDGTFNGFVYPGPTGGAIPMNTGRLGLGAVVANGYIYVFGGKTIDNGGTGFLNSIEKTHLSSDGTFSSWSVESTTLPNLRAYVSANYYNGYIYISGGVNKIGATTTLFNDVQIAQISTDGNFTVGSFTTASKTMSATRYGAGGIVHNNNLYIVGGCKGNNGSDNCNPSPTSNYAADTEYAPINNGGGGIGSWTTATNNFASRSDNTMVALNGYMYTIAGCTVNSGAGSTCKPAGMTGSVQYSAIGSDGSVGASAWSNTTTTPTARWGQSSIVANGRIYVFGGCDTVPSPLGGACSHDTATIQYAAPDSNGNITASWTTNTLNTPGGFVKNAPALFYNGFVYLLGQNSTVQYANVNSSTGAIGDVGGWQTSTTLNTSRIAPAGAIYNGYLYVLGGCCGAGSVRYNTVEFAKINSDGSLGSWSYTTSFNAPRASHLAVALDGFIYIYTGFPSNDVDVQFAPILANGQLGNWSFTTKFTTARSSGAGLVLNGLIYLGGGVDISGSLKGDIQYTPIAAIPRIGHYSRLLDSDVDTAPTKLIANGSKGGNDSAISLGYQTALNSGAALGNSQSVNPLTLASLKAITTVSGGVARYYWLNYTLDDSLSAVFPDTTSTATSLTDFTLYYHPNPAKRLRSGKTFTGQAQQSLDASP